MDELLPTLTTNKTVYKVSDFLSWMRAGTLVLSSSFQRRPVWKPGAKSYLIDTILRGLPIPVILIRERLDLDNQETIREVVDGQQRLRTVLSFVAPDSLKDFNEQRDAFTIMPAHNPTVAGLGFKKLPALLQQRILGFQFSTHVLGPETEDRDLLQIFARINATGVSLNHQELRNAAYSGEFKTLMYTLGFQQLDRWRKWGVFSEDAIARMKEVELVSDLAVCMLEGLVAKRQGKLDSVYKQYEDTFDAGPELARRAEILFDTIDEILGPRIKQTYFSKETMFFSLAMFLYDRMWGLGSSLKPGAKALRLSAGIADRLIEAVRRIQTGDAPQPVLDAVRRAPVDLARREVRHKYLINAAAG